jgi:hypothetical protein
VRAAATFADILTVADGYNFSTCTGIALMPMPAFEQIASISFTWTTEAPLADSADSAGLFRFWESQ